MKKLQLEKSHFSGMKQALTEVVDMGWCPMVRKEPAGLREDLHFHMFPNWSYMITGSVTFTDGEGNEYEAGAGDRILIPAKTLHAGSSDVEIVFVFSTPEPIWLGDKLTFEPSEL